MYGIFTYIYHKNQPNVGKYAIHGSSGHWSSTHLTKGLQRSPLRGGSSPPVWCIYASQRATGQTFLGQPNWDHSWSNKLSNKCDIQNMPHRHRCVHGQIRKKHLRFPGYTPTISWLDNQTEHPWPCKDNVDVPGIFSCFHTGLVTLLTLGHGKVTIHQAKRQDWPEKWVI